MKYSVGYRSIDTGLSWLEVKNVLAEWNRKQYILRLEGSYHQAGFKVMCREGLFCFGFIGTLYQDNEGITTKHRSKIESK